MSEELLIKNQISQDLITLGVTACLPQTNIQGWGVALFDRPYIHILGIELDIACNGGSLAKEIIY